MEQKVATNWRMTINEKKFIDEALSIGLRVDGRSLTDYRQLIIKFGREDGTVEVQLGQTHVMGCVTCQLVQPYRDRPNEGTLAIFTEFSPMADPSFEPGRPGESAIELGRVVDRGLRESRAVDMESLCVVSGKYVWAIRVDLHILDNCGNLIDAANIAALAALLVFRRPDCSLIGENGQEVVVHPPEIREPLSLIIHHLPVAVTFAIFKGGIVIIDPTHHEEAVMGGKMTVTMNTNNELCAIQKAGGEGILPSSIGDCLHIASLKVADITSKIKNAVELYDNERTLKKVKRHSAPEVVDVESISGSYMDKMQLQQFREDALKKSKGEDDHGRSNLSRKENYPNNHKTQTSVGAASNWDPYSKGGTSNLLRQSLVSLGSTNSPVHHTESLKHTSDVPMEEANMCLDTPAPVGATVHPKASSPKSLRDAVKPKHQRKKKGSSSNGAKCMDPK